VSGGEVKEASVEYRSARRGDDCPVGYKRTEVGVIPQDWECKLLGECGDVVRGGSPRPAGDSKYFNGNYIPWLTVASLTNIPSSQIYVTSTETMLTKSGSLRSRTLEKGTLIISNSGATLGVAKILDIKCCANDGVAAIINQRIGNKEFLVHFINTKTKELHDEVATGNGQPNLNTKLIRAIPVPYPPGNEQAAIANALSDVDALITSLERLITKKRAIKTAAMQQLLTGKTRLPPFCTGKHLSGDSKDGEEPVAKTHTGYKQTELGEIPEDWEIRRLGDIGVFSKGTGVKKDESKSGSIPCVRYGEIYTLHHDYIKEFDSHISKPVSLTATKITKGDLLFAASGETKEEIGKCVAFLDEFEAYTGGDIVILRPYWGDSLFLGYCLNSDYVVKQKSSKGQGDAVVHISASSLESVQVIVPRNEVEQQAIASVLFDMDKDIDLTQKHLSKTRQIKQAMMQQLLTGKTRLV